jgi:hypothetical protein
VAAGFLQRHRLRLRFRSARYRDPCR